MSRLEGISGKPKSRSRRLHYSAEKLQIGPKISLSRFPKTSLVSNDSGVFSPRRDLRFAPPSQNVFLRFIVSRADAAGLPCCHTSQPSRAALIFNYGNLISESQSQQQRNMNFWVRLTFFSPFGRLSTSDPWGDKQVSFILYKLLFSVLIILNIIPFARLYSTFAGRL